VQFIKGQKVVGGALTSVNNRHTQPTRFERYRHVIPPHNSVGCVIYLPTLLCSHVFLHIFVVHPVSLWCFIYAVLSMLFSLCCSLCVVLSYIHICIVYHWVARSVKRFMHSPLYIVLSVLCSVVYTHIWRRLRQTTLPLQRGCDTRFGAWCVYKSLTTLPRTVNVRRRRQRLCVALM